VGSRYAITTQSKNGNLLKMPVIFQPRIYRNDLQANPDVLYVFGDNLLRQGMGGQAGEMRGEPNAIGLPTKRKPTMEDDAFLSDDDIETVYNAIQSDLKRLVDHLADGGIVVWPLDGIGTGLAQLQQKAPEIYDRYFDTLDVLRTVFPE
jgi:hypothetical protein